MLYAGFAPRVFATLNIQAAVYSTFVYQPVERVLQATRASAKTRNLFRHARIFLKSRLVRFFLTPIIAYPKQSPFGSRSYLLPVLLSRCPTTHGTSTRSPITTIMAHSCPIRKIVAITALFAAL